MKLFTNLKLRFAVTSFHIIAIIGATLFGVTPSVNAQVTANTWYVIVNRHSGMAMDIAGASTDLGAALTQWNRTDAQNQQFRFADSGNGFYRIIARHSGQALDVYAWNAEDGADIVQWDDLNATNQQFRLDDMGSGYYRLVNNFSGKALDNWDWSTVAGTRISQYTPSDAFVQQWQLIAVGSGSGGNPTPTPTPNPGNGSCGSGSPNATVTGSSGNYLVNGNSAGSNYFNAIMSAVNSVSSGQRVSVIASGSIGANSVVLPSNIVFEVCGTMNVGNLAGRGAIEAIGRTNVSIPFLNMTGNPYFGLRFAGDSNLHLGQINLQLSGGLGIRFERDLAGSSNVSIDYVYVSGTNNHGVETWNVDGLQIGTVVARNTAYAGLLLNNTRNANIGLVDGEGTATGTGYATLRFANENGRINGAYPTNIYVDRVISRGGGRGFFCVSNSGGAVINNIDLANNGNNSILIENCHNVTIQGGTINGGGDVRIAARTEFPNTSNVTISNLNITNTSVLESPCGDNVNWVNVNVQGGSYNVCN